MKQVIKGEDPNTHKTPNVKFTYLKSNFFRVVHVDGAIGGITPAGYVHMSIYSERAAIPREVIQQVNQDGTLGDELMTHTRAGVVREMEADLMMSVPVAQSLYTWLGQQLEKAQSQAQQSGKVS